MTDDQVKVDHVFYSFQVIKCFLDTIGSLVEQMHLSVDTLCCSYHVLNVDVLKSGFSLANASGELQKLMRGSLPPWCQARESKRLGQATHHLKQNIIATSKQTKELRDNWNPNNLHNSKDAHRPKPPPL